MMISLITITNQGVEQAQATVSNVTVTTTSVNADWGPVTLAVSQTALWLAVYDGTAPAIPNGSTSFGSPIGTTQVAAPATDGASGNNTVTFTENCGTGTFDVLVYVQKSDNTYETKDGPTTVSKAACPPDPPDPPDPGDTPTHDTGDGNYVPPGEDPFMAEWRANSSDIKLADVGVKVVEANLHCTDPVGGRLHRTDLGGGLIEYGYHTPVGCYETLGWKKDDWTGTHYAVPDYNPIVTHQQLLDILCLAKWIDNCVLSADLVTGDAPAVSAAGPVIAGSETVAEAEGPINALAHGYLHDTDLGNGLHEIGKWDEGVYQTLGWVQYEGNTIVRYAVPEVNAPVTIEQLKQLMVSDPVFS
jgi:hypothetical protein